MLSLAVLVRRLCLARLPILNMLPTLPRLRLLPLLSTPMRFW